MSVMCHYCIDDYGDENANMPKLIGAIWRITHSKNLNINIVIPVEAKWVHI